MRENFSGKSLPARNSGRELERGETDENSLLSPALSFLFWGGEGAGS